MSDISVHLVDRDAPALSPFLPGTQVQFAWDSTSLGYLKTCPRLYQYIMIDGWSGKDESVHLYFGIEYHTALEDFDKYIAEGLTRDDAIRQVVQDLLVRTVDWKPDETIRAGKYKNRRSLLRTVLGYLDHFAEDPAETLVLENDRPAVELSFRFELDWGPGINGGGMQYIKDPNDPQGIVEFSQPYLLSGHLDRVVSFGGGYYVMDRKTSLQTLGDYYFAQYEPHNQMTLYTLASKVILGSPIKGVIIDAAQILIDSNRYVRGFTYRTADQLEEWTDDLRYWFGAAEGYATAGYWPMNDTACDKFGGCQFRSICSKSPQVRGKFLASHFVKLPVDERWNPLKSR